VKPTPRQQAGNWQQIGIGVGGLILIGVALWLWVASATQHSQKNASNKASVSTKNGTSPDTKTGTADGHSASKGNTPPPGAQFKVGASGPEIRYLGFSGGKSPADWSHKIAVRKPGGNWETKDIPHAEFIRDYGNQRLARLQGGE
jgi:hypothetical protein